jgi:predicted DNA-binding protein (MmcQ/YjbR family)
VPDATADALAFLRARALALPGASEEFPWGESAFKVKGKVFVFARLHEGTLTAGMKLPYSHPYALTKPYAEPTGYGLGKHGWVTLTFRTGTDVPLDLLEEWLEESYRAIAPKKLVLELNARLSDEPLPEPPKPKRGPKRKASRKGQGARGKGQE